MHSGFIFLHFYVLCSIPCLAIINTIKQAQLKNKKASFKEAFHLAIMMQF
jgi:hypothetical protein